MADDFKSDLEMDRAALMARGIDPDYNDEGDSLTGDDYPMLEAVKTSGKTLGVLLQLIGKKLGFEINPTKDNELGFNEGGLSLMEPETAGFGEQMEMLFTPDIPEEKTLKKGLARRPGFKSFKEAKGQVSEDEVMEGLALVGEVMVPFYESGTNLNKVYKEYQKPEGKRNQKVIDEELGKAKNAALADAAGIVIGGVLFKYGPKALKGIFNTTKKMAKTKTGKAVGTGLMANEMATPATREYAAGGSVIKKLIKEYGDDVVDEIIEMISVFPKPQRMWEGDDIPKGGDYLNPATGEVISGRNASKARISISPEGKPSFKVSNDNVEAVGTEGKGNTLIKTNLFKKKAGWKWKDAPEGYEDAGTLISVENKGKHYYTVDTDFSKGVNLKKYENSPTEPRLRPTVRGQLELGPQVGTITVRGKEHPVYANIRTFNEGGAVEDQMEMMFKSSRTDPVSGNEVPIGSMPEEVRDDIPAMLSEGEYVVPADVVRYYGVKFFEDLRTNAKMGLQDMAENGRIGGEPVDGPQDQELSDEEFLMIVGNVMGGAPQEMNEGGVVRGYNQAGMVSATQPYTPNFQQVPGFSAFAQQPLAQQYLVPGAMTAGVQPDLTPTGTAPAPATPTGAAPVATPSPSPEYCSSLGMRYDANTKTCVPMQQQSDNDGPKPPEVEPSNWYDDIDWSDSIEKVDALTGDPTLIQKGASAIAGAAFGPLGAAAGPIMQVSNLADAHAMANVYEAMGDTERAEQIRGKIGARLEESKITNMAYNAIDSVFGADGDRKTMSLLKAAGVDMSSLDGKFGKELNTAMDNLLKTMGDDDRRKVRIFTNTEKPKQAAPTPKINEATTFKKAGESQLTETEALRRRQSEGSGSGSDPIQRHKDILAKSKAYQEKAKESGTTVAKQTQTGSKGYGDTSQVEKTTGGQGDQGRGSGWGGMNKGGLMKKKK